MRSEGHEAVSLRPLATSLGVSHVAVLHHYASRDELLAAVAVRGFDQLQEALDRAAPGERPRRAFRRLGEAYIAWACANGHLYRLMFATRLRASGEHPELEARAGRLFEHVAAVIARAQEARELRGGSPHDHAFFAWSAAHGAALLLLDEQATLRTLADRPPAELVAVVLDRVRRGTARRPRPSRPR